MARAAKGRKAYAAKAGEHPAAAGAARGGSHLWLQGLVCGAVLAFATPVAVLVGVMLMPALAASLLDARPGRPVARAVGLAGAAFTVAPLWHLIQGGGGVPAALDVLADPAVLAPAWLAGACGWALCELLPVLLRGVASLNAHARLAALDAEEKALREAWDLESEG
jgi:hypothetical protein